MMEQAGYVVDDRMDLCCYGLMMFDYVVQDRMRLIHVVNPFSGRLL
jgi:hypothetical protein